MTSAQVIWWHPNWRVRLAAAVTVLTGAVAAVAFGLGYSTVGALLGWLIAVTLVLQLRPWLYARVPRAQVALRLATIVLFAAPVLTITTTPVQTPRPLASLGIGVAAGLILVAVHARDSRLLLDPGLVAVQPRMTPAGAMGRFWYVVIIVPLEELFYRKLLIDGFTPLVGIGLAVAISVAAFVYGDWSGSWGPQSSRKRLLSELALAVATAGTYAATGSLIGPLVTHYLYNGPQLALPPINLVVHRRSTVHTSED